MASAFFPTGRPDRNVLGCGRHIVCGTSPAHIRRSDAARRALQYRGRSRSLRFLLSRRGAARSAADRHFDGGKKPGPRSAPQKATRRTVRRGIRRMARSIRSEEHTSELQSLTNLVCRLLLEKKKTNKK